MQPTISGRRAVLLPDRRGTTSCWLMPVGIVRTVVVLLILMLLSGWSAEAQTNPLLSLAGQTPDSTTLIMSWDQVASPPATWGTELQDTTGTAYCPTCYHGTIPGSATADTFVIATPADSVAVTAWISTNEWAPTIWIYWLGGPIPPPPAAQDTTLRWQRTFLAQEGAMMRALRSLLRSPADSASWMTQSEAEAFCGVSGVSSIENGNRSSWTSTLRNCLVNEAGRQFDRQQIAEILGVVMGLLNPRGS